MERYQITLTLKEVQTLIGALDNHGKDKDICKSIIDKIDDSENKYIAWRHGK